MKNIEIKELWLPAEYFELDEDKLDENKNSQIRIVDGKKYLNITWFKGGLEQYSFKSNRIKFDSDWWDDFIIEF